MTEMFALRWRTFAQNLLSILRIAAAFVFIQFGTAKLFAFQPAFMPDGRYGDLVRHYFDQSHFVKEFKRYSGLTPTAYFRVNDYGRVYIPDGRVATLSDRLDREQTAPAR